jgi:hypothetical protein
MSKFHFDEGTMNGVAASLEKTEQNIGQGLISLNNALLELYGSDGFNVGTSISRINEERSKISSCVESIKNGAETLSSVAGIANRYEIAADNEANVTPIKYASKQSSNDSYFARANVSDLNDVQNTAASTGSKIDYDTEEMDKLQKTGWKYAKKVAGKVGVVGSMTALFSPFAEMIYKSKNGTIDWDDYTDASYIVSVLKSGNSALKSISKIDVTKGTKEWLLGVKSAVSEGAKVSSDVSIFSAFKTNVNKSGGILDDYNFSKDSTKATFSVVSTAFSAVSNGIDNYNEYKSGEISAFRAVEETIGETVVDTAVDWAIGTAIAAAATTVGAPAVVAGVVTVGVSWAADTLCKKLYKAVTGEEKGLTEVVSDFYIDNIEKQVKKKIQNVQAVGSAVVSGAKSVISSATKMLTNGFNVIGYGTNWGFKSLLA